MPRRRIQYSLLALMEIVTACCAVLSLGMAMGPAWRGGIAFWTGAVLFFLGGAKGRPLLMVARLVLSSPGIVWAALAFP